MDASPPPADFAGVLESLDAERAGLASDVQPELVEYLDDLRVTLVEVLERFGPDPATLFAAVLDGDTDGTGSVDLLRHAGRLLPVPEDLAARLESDSDRAERAVALSTLMWPRPLEVLSCFARDTSQDPWVRTEAVEALGSIAEQVPDSVQGPAVVMTQTLPVTEAELAEASAEAVTELRWLAVHGVDVEIRLCALRCLAWVDPALVDDLCWERLLRDSDPEIRAAVAAGIAHAGRADLRPQLEGLLDDHAELPEDSAVGGDGTVAEAAATAIHDLDALDDAVPDAVARVGFGGWVSAVVMLLVAAVLVADVAGLFDRGPGARESLPIAEIVPSRFEVNEDTFVRVSSHGPVPCQELLGSSVRLPFACHGVVVVGLADSDRDLHAAAVIFDVPEAARRPASLSVLQSVTIPATLLRPGHAELLDAHEPVRYVHAGDKLAVLVVVTGPDREDAADAVRQLVYRFVGYETGLYVDPDLRAGP